MIQNLNNFLKDSENKQYATQIGTDMHTKLQHIIIDANCEDKGDEQIIFIIKSKPELLPFFDSNTQTEVPIAGYANGVFISRRIDRLLINHETQTICFIDYKTDSDKTLFFDMYQHHNLDFYVNN